MALILANRVKETTTTQGTGTITLSGSTFGGFQSFSDAIGEGNTTYYCIQNESNFEIGIGTFSSNTLSRDTILESSNSGSKISIVGAAIVFCVIPSQKAVFKDEDDSLTLPQDLNIDDLSVDHISANSGDFSGPITSSSLSSVSISANDITASGSLNSSGLLTLRRESAGNFFHAYIDDLNDRTVGLYSDGVTPTWRLGLKNSPSDETDPPSYGYVYATDGGFGLIGNSNNQLSLSNTAPFLVKHQGVDVITAHYVTGVHLQSNSSAYPSLIVNGGAALSADIQRWDNNAGTTLSVVDNAGNFGIRNSNPSYQLDVTGTGNFSQSIRFGDGTVQSTAYVNSSGELQSQITQNAEDIVTVSGLLGSSSSVSGIVFEKSGSNDEYRIGTIFVDPDGTEQVVRATDFNGGFLRLEVARFSPSVSAAGQSRSWDQPVTQWTVTVDNPTDFTTNYVSGVKSPLTGITGSVTSDVTLYSTSGPSVTPGGGVDWTQTFSTDGDSPIYSSTNDLTGGSASATVSFLDKNQATISETATISFNWSTASNAISFGNLSGKNFLETYTSTTYNLTINNISDLSNTSTTITSSQGSLSNSSDDGTITFTTAIHKDNNSGRTITATTDFTRPATVTGTEYTVQDVSSDSSISATFTYPSFYIFTASTSNVPSRADVVDTNDFDSSTVTELGNQVKVIDQYINNPDGVPKCWWFGVRSSASQPTSFETGSGPSLLVSASPTQATVDLEPDSPPAGYNSEEYKLYGITLNPGNTYVKIS